MTNESTQTTSTTQQTKPFLIGVTFRNQREALGYAKKDVASQIRLNENLIDQLENDSYPHDIPVTFLRGYIRLYGKFLQIPDHDIKAALEPITPKESYDSPKNKLEKPISSHHYFIQIFTCFIFVTLLGLVGAWWYNHSKSEETIKRSILSSKPGNYIAIPTQATTLTNLNLQPKPVEKINPEGIQTVSANPSVQNTANIANNKKIIPQNPSKPNDDEEEEE